MASHDFEKYDVKVPYKDTFINIDIFFKGYATITYYCPAHTNCAADYASDSELEYETEVDDVKWRCYDDDGEEIPLTNEQKEVCDKYAEEYAEDCAREFDDWYFN